MAAIGKAIVSLLSSVNSGKVYPLKSPQTVELPHVVYSIVDTVPVNQKSGSAPVDDYRMQLDVFSYDYDDLDIISAAIRSAIDAYSGVVAGVTIIDIELDDQRDLYEEKALAFHRSLDYIIKVRN